MTPRRDWLRNLTRALTDVARPLPLTVLWRWRYELLVIPSLGYFTGRVIASVGVLIPAAAFVVLAGIVLGVAPLRRFAIARAWCIITPHRIRTACAEARIHTRKGRLPAILYTRARPYGERVYLWCPAGIIAPDFADAEKVLRAACLADNVWVEEHPRWPQIVMLSVVRGGRARGYAVPNDD